ncbi:GtrA family protein [Pedococcus cremeus]|uniref:GtrA family protein n=1 Tax=Pedococcus cremeus TaxID=587636 RepID=UPI0015A68499|nr:GtrA family protein [Pedococcus cremeus]
MRFALVGVGSTLAHLALFTVILGAVEKSQLANLIALAVATVANTAANRRWTFGIRGSTAVVRQHFQAFVLFFITWGLSSAALGFLHHVSAAPRPLTQVVVVALSMAGSTLLRFAGMRAWIFRQTQ